MRATRSSTGDLTDDRRLGEAPPYVRADAGLNQPSHHQTALRPSLPHVPLVICGKTHF
jgi:hypothetical protein